MKQSLILTILVTLTSFQRASAIPFQVRADLDSCLNSAGLTSIYPSSSGYASAAQAYNLRFQYSPAALVYPTSENAVAAAVKCAGSLNVPVSARSGGHSYAAYGLGGQDGALVVDLSKLKAITINSDQTATIQTGNRLGDVALTLYNNGGRAMPHGTSPEVGVGGHLGCGGFGLDSRMWGLFLDQALSARVVLSNGTIVAASPSENSDLFWAIRGAAPSFGIVTEYKFKTYPAPSSNIIFSYSYWSTPQATASSIFSAFQTFAQTSAPPTLGIQAILASAGAPGQLYVSLTGVFYGTKSDFNNAINPLLTKIPKPQGTSVVTYGWLDSLVQLGGQSLNTSTTPDGTDTFFAKSLMVPQEAPMTSAAIQSFFNYLGNQGTSSDTVSLTTLYSMHCEP
ncbi:hypothetical protein HGRIS_013391 [Hohenbuehelia grisea]|uniref:FAD-binding PCMH-type domain-containing protein n=1 Tax=Hohenbuehelia grisea TaxID=104357 RepID=A0ABR3IV99_9AGAR